MNILPVGQSALLIEIPDAPGEHPSPGTSDWSAVQNPTLSARAHSDRTKPVAAAAAAAAADEDPLGPASGDGRPRESGRHAGPPRPELSTPAIPGAPLSSGEVAEIGAPVSPISVYRSLRATAPAWVIELVPAAHTVLVAFDRSRVAPSTVREWIARTASTSDGSARSASSVDAAQVPSSAGGADAFVEISVRYEGDDLTVVADLTGTSVEDVIAAHTGQLWTAAFIGFAPGFAYLTGEDDRLTVPRRAVPRPVVPAGSVALAAGYCGVYPRESPGGWHLIGTTSATLWDPRRPEPALLVPGTRVRFVRE